LPIYGGSDNRSIEYDTVSDAYARFLFDELLVAIRSRTAARFSLTPKPIATPVHS
jgi:hypothetical protein